VVDEGISFVSVENVVFSRVEHNHRKTMVKKTFNFTRVKDYQISYIGQM